MESEFLVEDQATFTAWDYAVFGIILAMSAGIGLYYGLSGGRQKTSKEFLMANRSMSAFPVALSVLASFFSASTLLGTPAEIYMEGGMYYISIIGAVLAPLVGAFVFGPFFFKLKVVSVFEYLEKRFQSKAVRVLGAILFIIRSTIGMGIVLYGPSTALNEVSGFPTWAGIVVVGCVCAFYTSVGGLKAVIWTDVFQTFVMLAGMCAVLIKGAMEVGGFSNAWNIADDNGRLEFFDFDPDPTLRHSFWILVVGNFFNWLYPYTVDQQMIQRFGATKSLKQAKISLLLNIPGMFIIITLSCMAGLFMFAFYADCDPLSRGTVSDPNQLMPRYVLDILGFAPGLPGLFMASLFSGALSSVSSMINSLAAVTWADICKLCFCSRKVKDTTATTITKLIGVIYAGVGIGMAFMFANIGGTVLQMSLAFNGAAGAPLVGIFCLGCFFPWTNWIGAFVGAVLGFAVPMWINIGAYITKPNTGNNFNFSTEGCPRVNLTDMTTYLPFTSGIPMTTTPMEIQNDEITGINKLYTLSYMWYTPVGIMVTIVFGLLVSFMSGYTHAGDVNPKYMMSYVDTFWPCFPKSCRQKSTCGVHFETISQDDDTISQFSDSDSEDAKKDEIKANGYRDSDASSAQEGPMTDKPRGPDPDHHTFNVSTEALTVTRL